MQRNQEQVSAGGIIVLLVVLFNTIVLEQGLTADPKWYKLCYVTFPLMVISIILYRRKLL